LGLVGTGASSLIEERRQRLKNQKGQPTLC
jgi:hypothetical protein